MKESVVGLKEKKTFKLPSSNKYWPLNINFDDYHLIF